MDKITDLNSYKKKKQEELDQNLIDEVINDENKLVCFLAAFYLETERKGLAEVGKKVIADALNAKRAEIEVKVLKLINSMRSQG